MWVEICSFRIPGKGFSSSSSWGCELKWVIVFQVQLRKMSSSSWGCELKYLFFKITQNLIGHPLREDVSWNKFAVFFNTSNNGHPLREDVSWNNPFHSCERIFLRHPLREDVSWNTFFVFCNLLPAVILFVRMWVEIFFPIVLFFIPMSSSSWGCELKYPFVRNLQDFAGSSSSWGCELK